MNEALRAQFFWSLLERRVGEDRSAEEEDREIDRILALPAFRRPSGDLGRGLVWVPFP